MLKIIGCGFALLTVGTSWTARAEAPSFKCVISSAGKQWDIYGANDSSFNLKCDYVRCAMTDRGGGPNVKGECNNVFLLKGEINKLLCGNGPDNKLNLGQVIGVSHSCSPQ
jgi:hypothetical protein